MPTMELSSAHPGRFTEENTRRQTTGWGTHKRKLLHSNTQSYALVVYFSSARFKLILRFIINCRNDKISADGYWNGTKITPRNLCCWFLNTQMHSRMHVHTHTHTHTQSFILLLGEKTQLPVMEHSPPTHTRQFIFKAKISSSKWVCLHRRERASCHRPGNQRE